MPIYSGLIVHMGFAFADGKHLSNAQANYDKSQSRVKLRKTGELLPADNILNNPQIIRPLFVAIQALEKAENRAARDRSLPENAARNRNKTSLSDHKMFLIFDKMTYLSSMRNTMPASSPKIPSLVTDQLAALGDRIRARRKALRVSATALAEAAGMSRVTVHRIEQGEPSVTMGAYMNVLAALGMTFAAAEATDAQLKNESEDKAGWLPTHISLADYPQLKQLAWQVQGTDELTPREAAGIYERNKRHLDEATLLPREQHLIDALRLVFGSAGLKEVGDV